MKLPTSPKHDTSEPRAIWRDAVILILVATALTLLLQVPYFLGYKLASAETVYTGLLVNVEDANYITIIQRGSEGAWTHSLRFTSEPDTPAFLYVFYLALGHVARLAHLDATTMWHIARSVMIFLVCLVTFGFIATFIDTSSQRMVAFLLAVFGAGFDWVAFPWETLAPASATPVDLKMADAHLFAAALTFPHYLASIVCMVIVFWCGVRLLTEKMPRGKFWLLVVCGALANVAVELVYPFFVILTVGVLGVYLVILMLRARRILPGEALTVAMLLVPVLPLLFYYQAALASSELLRVWSAQSQTLSPNPLHYVLTYLPYLVLALLGLWRVGVGEEPEATRRVFLWTWVVVVALLVYAPLGAQRRFLQGVQIPLALLATLGLYQVVLPRLRHAGWFEALARRPNYSADGLQRLLLVLLALVVSVSSAFQWLSAVELTTISQPYPLFRPRQEIEAMDSLHTFAKSDDVVLSAYFTGSYLPLRGGTRVYLGHVYETIHFQDKQRAVDVFFDAQTRDADRLEFLRANQIRYLFYGPAERVLRGFEPGEAPFLQLRFQNFDVAIYEVVAP